MRFSMRFKIIVLSAVALLPIGLFFIFFLVPQFRGEFLKAKSDTTKATVGMATGIVEHYYSLFQSGKLTESDAKVLALQEIRKLRYLENEYVWINDMDNKMLMHPIKPELEGKELSGLKDANGVAIFPEMIKVVKSSGEGEVEYLWPKPGHEKPVAKISYVKGFKAWGWVIGTGLYLDDVNRDAFHFLWMALLGLLVAVAFSGVCAVFYSGTLAKQMTRITCEVATEADNLDVTAQELSVSSEGLAEGTQKQAAALQQTTASLHQVNAMLASSRESTTMLSEASKKSATSVQQGQNALVEMQATMKHLESAQSAVMNQVERNNEELAQITRVIKEIEDKTKMINDIVFQTKLLSFNASVEAARAGEAGKGFAVVAEEVGSLARMSGSAALEISQILDKSHRTVEELASRSRQNVSAILEEAGRAVGEGNEVAGKCKVVFDDIVQASESVGRMIEQINRAAEEQERGVKEISSAMDQLDEVMQKNASEAQGVAKASEALKSRSAEVHHTASEMEALVTGADRPKNQIAA